MYIEFDNVEEPTAQVGRDVLCERQRQDKKWGEQNHAPDRWFRILLEELGEAAEALEDNDLASYDTEMVQVAAVACAAVECVRRNR